MTIWKLNRKRVKTRKVHRLKSIVKKCLSSSHPLATSWLLSKFVFNFLMEYFLKMFVLDLEQMPRFKLTDSIWNLKFKVN